MSNLMGILVLTLLFAPSAAFAKAKFTAATCAIEIPINQWMSKEHLVSGSLKVEFDAQNSSVPTMTIDLDRRLDNPAIDLVWNEIDLIDRYQRGIFDSDYQQELLANHKLPIPFFSEDGRKFMAHSVSLQNIQNFFSLFLSQFSLTLQLKSDSYGYEGDVVVALSGSDLAVRELANRCFSETSKTYLNGLTRQLGYKQSWKTSYGIFEFNNLSESSPEAYQYRKVIEPTSFAEVSQSQQGLVDLKRSLENRQEWISEIRKLRGEESYASLFTNESNIFDLYFATKAEIRSSESESGLIESSRSDLVEYSDQLKANQKNFVEAKDHLLALRQEDFAKSIVFKEFQDQLQAAQESFNAVEVSRAVNEVQIARVTEILNSLLDLKQSTEIELQNNSGDIVDSAFMSLRQIEDRTKRLFDLHEKEKRISTQLASLSVMVDMLREAAAKQGPVLEAYQRSIETKARMTQITKRHVELQGMEVELHDKRGGIGLDKIAMFLSEDIATGEKSWTHAELISEVTGEVVQSYKTFEANLQAISEQAPTAILPKLLCTPDSFKATSFMLCLDINIVEDDRALRQFFESLGSERLDTLIGETLSVTEPYFGEGLSKIDRLMQEAQLEKIALESSGLIEEWNRILYSRWKFFKVKTMADDQLISWSNFQDQFAIERGRLIGIEGSKDKLLVDYTLANQIYVEANSEYARLEDEYFANIRRVRQSLFTIIELDQIEGDIVECLSDEPGSLPCFDEFASSTESLENQSQENQKEISSSIKLLTFEASYLLGERLKVRKQLTEDNQKLKGQIDGIESAIESSGLASELEQLSYQLQWARKRHEQLTSERLRLLERQDRTKDRLELGLARNSFLKKSLFWILPKISSYQNLIKDYCIKEGVILKQIQSIDTKLSSRYDNLSVTVSFNRQRARVCSLL